MFGIGMKAATARKLTQLLSQGPGTPGSRSTPGGGIGRRPALVRCVSATPAGDEGPAAECHPGVIVDSDPAEPAAEQPTLGEVWLTLLGDGGAAAPTAGRVYTCLLAGEFDPTPEGGDSDPRPRAFGAAVLGPDALSAALSAALTACDKLFGLTAADCPTFTVAYRGGACAQVPFQSGAFAFDPTVSTVAGLWTWVSEVSFRTDPSDPEDPESAPTKEGFLQLTVKGGPRLVLVDSPGGEVLYEFEWAGCRDGKWRFLGTPDGACSGAALATCGDNTFAVDIDCGACAGVTVPCCPGVEIPKRLCLTLSDPADDLGAFVDAVLAAAVSVVLTFDGTAYRGRLSATIDGAVKTLDFVSDGCGSLVILSGAFRVATTSILDGSFAVDSCDPYAASGVLRKGCCNGTDYYGGAGGGPFATFTLAPVPADGCGDAGSAGGGNGDGGGDSCDNATGIGCDDAVSVTIPAGQSRWFKVTVPAGKEAAVTATFSPAPTGVGMRLWDADDIPECPPQPPGGDAALPVGPGTPEVTMSVTEGVYFVELANPGPETTATLAVACSDAPAAPTYDCVDGECVENPDGIGEFDSPEECAANCGTPPAHCSTYILAGVETLAQQDATTWAYFSDVLTYLGGDAWQFDTGVGTFSATGWDGTGCKTFVKTAGVGSTYEICCGTP